MATAKYSIGKSFDYVQETPATTWTVDYIYSYLPVVEVMINNPATGNLEKALPKSIQLVNSHTVAITFSQPFSGRVHIAG